MLVLSFVYAAGPRQRSLSRIRVPWMSRPYFTLSFETSLFVASYDSQGHGGGIRPRLHTQTILTASYIGLAWTIHRKHMDYSTTDIMYCCQTCPPMHCLAMDALLLCILCCDMSLLVCYLAMDALLLLDVRWLENIYLFFS
jgi:hypothetical protein